MSNDDRLIVDQNIVQDNTYNDFDSALDAGSDTTSLRLSILQYREENGRTYHAYKDGAYVLPNDEIENERLDLQHHLFLLTFDEKLHTSPLPKSLKRAFDSGCSTGIWAIEFADEHPECEVIGVDLSPIQPVAIPPNASFFVDDLEEPWDYSQKFDFVFARFLTGSIRDWTKFFNQSFQNLNPGGRIEMIDILYPLQSDDGTLTKDSASFRWSELLLDIFTKNNTPMDSALKYKEQLEEAGFVDIHIVKRLWTQQNALDALEALSLAVFTRPEGRGGLGWSKEEVRAFLTDVRKDIKNVNIHSYWPIWSVYATKPEEE
ncbi:S-adenosyl-L-methionine-dependent methyltransferase [Fusarium tricinctum]|uniref:S-adenosyl-L-methionine-dependent methyltransferase n=1 Tax=Fusarium tricinctum TaxID=61284 RepID=A0A8K0S0B3_9HYPO|nr:S-adenosyl-L-methionine-dependent methyltransferase [Fusarium tricinctum]